MKKYAKRIFAFLLVFTLVFGISGVAAPQTADAWTLEYLVCVANEFSTFGCAIRGVIVGLMEAVLGLAGLIVGLAGVMLNGIVYHTVVNVANNYGNITAINSAWTTVRDLANMVFIFLLLYVAIRTILGQGEESKKLIVNIIIVAILINFSLFFTKIVIDASNILALFFYNAISPGAVANGFSLAPGSTSIADQFMSRLELTNLYNVSKIDTSAIFTMGIMGTIMLMIAAFVFFSIAIMFVVRYVVLILVLILSPLAFLSYAFPALRSVGKKWLDALIGQAFFAPIYFMITWIALKVLGDIAVVLGINTGDLQDARRSLSQLAMAQAGQLTIEPFMVFLNFLVVIVFLIASLSIAKSWANKAGDGATKAHKLITGATIGTVAFAGRQTFGRAATRLSESEYWKNKAVDKNASAAGRMTARLALAAGRKGGAASYDVRGTGLGIGSSLDAGKAGGKGGYMEFRKKRSENIEKVAKSYGPSEVVIDQAQQEVKRAKTEEEKRVAQAKLNTLKGVDQPEVNRRTKEAQRARDEKLNAVTVNEKEWQEKIKNAEEEVAKVAIKDPANRAQKEQELENLKKDFNKTKESSQQMAKTIESAYQEEIGSIKKIPSLAKERAAAYAEVVEKAYIPMAFGYNKTAAARIRIGKSIKDKAVDALKDLQKEGVTESAVEEKPETKGSGGEEKTA